MSRQRRSQNRDNRNQPRRSRKKKSSKRAIITKTDIFITTMGWLWSLYGLFFTMFCTVGIFVVPHMMYKGIYNDPNDVTPTTIFNYGNDDVVNIEGVINKDEIIEYTSAILKNRFTMCILENTDRKVVLVYTRLLSDREMASNEKRMFMGTLHYPNSSGRVQIDTSKFYVENQYREAGIDIHDEIAIIEVGAKPEFSMGLVAYFGVLLAGFLYIFNKIRTAVYFMNHKSEFIRKILKHAEEADDPSEDDIDAYSNEDEYEDDENPYPQKD